MNLMMLLEMAASGYGDRVAVQDGNERLTYTELFSAAGAAAAEIRKSGCDRAAMLDVSTLALPVALFASAWSGVPFVPLSYRLTEDELDGLLERIVPAYLVTDDERARALSNKRGTTLVRREQFLQHARASDAGEAAWPMDPEDIAVLLFTSGTTGAPKAAVLRQRPRSPPGRALPGPP